MLTGHEIDRHNKSVEGSLYEGDLMLPELPSTDWTPALAGHLLNRAGFGADPFTVREFAALHPAEAVDRLIEFQSIPESFDPPAWALESDADRRPDTRERRRMTEEERRERDRIERQTQAEHLHELRGWWVRRMCLSPRPLQEKLTLFWHGHFATGAEKVRFTYPLYQQNQMLRANCAGNFEALVIAVSQDPAMLLYLDNALSRPERPNENYARELMELFTLGEGNYSEDDIKQLARALCGWTLHPEHFRFVDLPSRRDTGAKTLFNRTGNFKGAEAIRIVLEQRSAAPFICAKLWSFFAYENPESELVERMAAEFRKNRLELKPVLRSMFRSRAFYSAKARRSQIKSPAQWLVGAVRSLQAQPPETEIGVGMLAALGQNLFAPPNVKGWPGGYTWITTDSLLKRYNLAGFLVKGGPAMVRRANEAFVGSGPFRGQILQALASMPPAVDPARAVPDEERAEPERLVRYLEWLLFQAPLHDKEKDAVRAYLAKRASGPITDAQVRDLLHIMMSTPHYQLT